MWGNAAAKDDLPANAQLIRYTYINEIYNLAYIIGKLSLATCLSPIHMLDLCGDDNKDNGNHEDSSVSGNGDYN